MRIVPVGNLPELIENLPLVRLLGDLRCCGKLEDRNQIVISWQAGQECSVVIPFTNRTDMTPLTTFTADILAIPVEADLFRDVHILIVSSR